ncbi:helix-turn-helix domain-containing protein [Pseudarthrobacter sp. N5]|uniref:helix-turn-helix domain-containing protein n=1 Tax=Pseudarthrobacter sp. N5 TaxID=3418416 RepID=UPI003CEB4DA4
MVVAVRGVLRSGRDLGLLVQTIRVQAGLTQAQMVERLDVSQRYLSELETGRPKALNKKLFEIIDMLGIEISFTTDNHD